MPKFLWDFQCQKCDNIFEEFVERDTLLFDCPECKTPGAVRQIAAPRLDARLGLDDGFPTAVQKWEKSRRQHHSARDDD